MPLEISDYRLWRKRIEDAEGFQAQQHPLWKKSLDLYSMKYWEQFGFAFNWEDELVPVNYATTFVSTLVAALFARNPKMFVRARTGTEGRFAKFADTMEAVLERHWDENDVKDVMIQVIRDAIIHCIGWVEVGFVPASGRPIPEAQQTNGGFFAQAREMMSGLIGTRKEKIPPQVGELQERKCPGQFYTIRRSPYDVLVPAQFADYWSLPYLIVRDRLMVEDFLANPHYLAKDRIGHGTPVKRESESLIIGPKFSFGGTAQGIPTDQHVIDLYTIWDRRSESVFTVSKLTEQAHLEPKDWPHYAEGFPVIELRFNAVPNTDAASNFYPFGDILPIFAQILEKSKSRTQMAEIRRRANIAVFVQRGTSTESELLKYAKQSGMVEVIPVSNIGAIQVSPAIRVPDAVIQTENAINSDLDRDSGLQLILADLARTQQIERATVAAIAQGNANLKTSFRVDRIEAFAKHIARYQSGLFWQYMRRMDVGELLGRLPSEEEWPALPDDPRLARQRVRKELELRIEAGSTRPIQDDVLDRQQFINASAVIQNVAPQLFRRIEQDWVVELVRRFRMPSLEQKILAASDEEEQETAQREEELLSQNIPQVVSPCHGHDAHLRVHAAASQRQPTQARDQHILEHNQFMQRQMAGSTRAAQGTRQMAAAPSAAEVRQQGVPSVTDLLGQAMNLRKGTGGQPVTI